MDEPVKNPGKKLPNVELVWDKQRIIIGLTLLAVLFGVAYFAKIMVLDKREEAGKVAGTTVEEEQNLNDSEIIRPPTLEELDEKTEKLKKDISELTPEDVAKQEPVKKIIQDLENLKNSTQEQIVGGTKNAVCEEVKKIFCSQ